MILCNMYTRLRKRFSISLARNFYLVVTFIVGFYLLCLMTFVRKNEHGRNIFNSSISNGEATTSYGGSSGNNYFLHAARLHNLQRAINTPSCQVPDFDAWDKDVMPFIKVAQAPVKCNEANYNWSYVRNNKLVINRRQIELDGYSLYKGFCCYKVVERVTLTKDEERSQSQMKNGDNLIKYSKCVDINKEETELHHEFIVVECGMVKLVSFAVAYRGFHAIATVRGSQKSQNLEQKILHWRFIGEEERLPPNVLILGLDSTSRLNFRRNMFKTQKILEELGAVEMMGYTKVGSNTYPNFVPLSSGYSEEELQNLCYFSPSTPQDECPYVVKRFDMADYIVAHSEDSPVFAIYNYLKTGFIHQPFDFYLRPLMQAAHDYGHPPLYILRKESMDCIGQQTNDEVILSYVESVLDLGYRNNTPVYSVSWSTHGSHEDLNNLQLVDDTYSTFLMRISDKGYLDNTIIFFMSDHGYRYGPFRNTLIGYYEDKLPNMWIRLPPWIREEFPDWQSALEINSRRLTSPFTMYKTLNILLEMFSSLDPPHDAKNIKTGEIFPRKHNGQHFFEIVPEENTCADVGVPEEYCACYLPQQVALKDPLLIEAAATALQSKNRDLPSTCAALSVGTITAGTVVTKSSGSIKRFIAAFTTKPGNFKLEAEIDYIVNNATFSGHPSVHRTNKINQDHIKCIKDSKLELFCFCIY